MSATQAPLFADIEHDPDSGSKTEARTRARLALPVPIDSLFDYAVPDEMAEHARPGCRALVRFSGRRLTGLVVEVGPARPGENGGEARALEKIERVLDVEPVVSQPMISLLLEAAGAALCPPGLALALALPPASSPRLAQRLRLSVRGRRALESGLLEGSTAALLAPLARADLSARALAARAPGRGGGADPARLRALVRDGLLESLEVETGPGARPATRRVARVAPGTPVESTCESALARAPTQAALLRRLAREGPLATADLAAAGPLRALVQRGFVTLEVEEAPRNVLGPPVERDEPPVLTSEQAAARDLITAAVRERRTDTFLLHGVTGSGKTEVYLQAVGEALRLSRQALVLVPEITLTHQILARLRARFGDGLAILHSGLRPGERLEQWQRLRRGEVPIAVGARSALFAPLENLGVIVVDEEHDGAYKNEEGFRYHARDLAARRARIAQCPVVLGSATPALETRHAADRGEMARLVLSRRIGGRPLPAVELVDLARERASAPRGRKLVLGRSLRRALAATLAEGGQSILFLNRRGFSTQIYCFECGHAERCADCDVALVYHATENRLRCHYCDFAKPPPAACAGCGAPETALLGLGTERVEEEVRTLFPEARLARLDRDTAQRRGHTESVLRALRAREVDVVVGTQMVAKGHDFPGVQLVGVVAADLGLHMPDFRAAERTFQVLTQVAGRAGRAGAPGRVVVQTFVPDHYAIAPVRTHDYETFYQLELEQRESMGYPPFSRLAQLIVSDREQSRASAAAEELAALARAEIASPGGLSPHTLQLLGPAPAPLARLRGRHRFQLLLKGPGGAAFDGVCRALATACAAQKGDLRASLDVAPGSML